MLLKNKKTNEEVEINIISDSLVVCHADGEMKELKLSDLKDYEEWEDYEEPKLHWYIYGAEPFEVDEQNMDKDYVAELKSIGNYFENREEAEKAVEKLKAWKRLRDIGCRFILDDNFAVKFVGPEVTKIVSAEEGRMLCDDYRLLFGGEDGE